MELIGASVALRRRQGFVLRLHDAVADVAGFQALVLALQVLLPGVQGAYQGRVGVGEHRLQLRGGDVGNVFFIIVFFFSSLFFIIFIIIFWV